MKEHATCCRILGLPCAAPAFAAAGLSCTTALCQTLPPELAAQFNDIVGNRAEALSILTGDYGVSGGIYSLSDNSARTAVLDLYKMSGGGEWGEPRAVGNLCLRWQPRLQGALGYLEASNKFRRGLLDGDDSKYSIFAMQCGGGVRLWWTDHISLAPTITGMYAYTRNSYSANSQFAITHEDLLTQTGLIRWHANTWTVIPGVELQYEYTWHRTVLTLSSTFGFYHTGSFDTSTPNLQMRGDSEMWRNKIDADIPLRIRLLGHELRAGGYFSRTDLAGNLEKGLNVDHIYDIHGRVVLDFLGKFWKLKWLGLGGSYLWGPQFTGWAIGGDVQFKF